MTPLLLLCLCVTVALAQVPTPCMTPAQWQGRVFTVDREKMFGRYGMAFYDATNTRVRIVEEVKEGSSDNFYDKLDLFNIQRRYVVNLKTRVCNTTSLTRPFRPFAVPFDARFETQANLGVIGNQQEEVTVQNFSGNTTDGGRYLIGVSSPDCLPIYDFYNSNATGFVRTNFFDLTMGIVDPSIFIPPRECSP
ncbi:hypothetical protein ScPMuIL_014256 [Solemya velum]